MSEAIIKTINLGDGREITIETGRLARQADGAVVVKMGGCMLLATVVSAKDAKDDVDFMPITVDYREKFSAAGRFPGGFLKRESRPTDEEILVARLIDRALRPLFPADYHAETALMISLISHDDNVMPDALAGLAASAAIQVSDIPFECPISEVRVGRVNGEFIINPSRAQLDQSDIDIMVGASHDNIMMVEGEFDEISEEEMLEAIKIAHDAIRVHCKVQEELAAAVGKTKRVYCHEVNDEAIRKMVNADLYADCYKIATQRIANKHERGEAFGALVQAYVEKYTEANADNEDLDKNVKLIKRYYHDVEKEAMRRMILDEGIRLDGRTTTQIRPIWGEVDYLPGAHGSSLFTRGETQSLSSVTLGTKLDEKMIDSVTEQGTSKFLLHYNFPPFSVAEPRTPRGLSRREIGHGNLAYRALKRMIPQGFPYTVRVVSDILESNGSSSMATVCAGTMALMDAGVKIKRPVSGIAMGLITDNEKFAVLSDILGDEDHLGDMDFKVTGTEKGITATQMDIKVDGLSYEILTQALHQAKQGREHIMGKILEVIDAPKADFKPHVPRIEVVLIPKDMIGAIIGPGGKNIQKLQEDTKTTITIEEKDNQGHVQIASANKENLEAAKEHIKRVCAVPEVGETYKGAIKSITSFGAFVEIMPGKEGLLHVSEIAWERVENTEDVLKVGEQVEVKLLEIDNNGKFKLSRKVLLPKPEGFVERPKRERPPREGGNREGGHRDDRRENREPRKPRD